VPVVNNNGSLVSVGMVPFRYPSRPLSCTFSWTQLLKGRHVSFLNSCNASGNVGTVRGEFPDVMNVVACIQRTRI
jgi:hypothetical protein